MLKWKPMDPKYILDDPGSDVRTAVSIEQCRISPRAVYFQNRQYLPLSAVTEAEIRPAVMRPNHCCGLGLPVSRLLLYYGAEKPLILTMSNEERAEKALSLVQAANPGVSRREETEADRTEEHRP